MVKFIRYMQLSLVSLVVGCASVNKVPPLTYLALEKPVGPIKSEAAQVASKEISRGGFYFFNYNFRPAADLEDYIKTVENKPNPVLRNVDVELTIPFAFDLLFFGYASGTDKVTISPDTKH